MGQSSLSHMLQLCRIFCSSYIEGFWKLSPPPFSFLLTEVLKYLIKSLITSIVTTSIVPFSSQGKLYFSSSASESPWEV